VVVVRVRDESGNERDINRDRLKVTALHWLPTVWVTVTLLPYSVSCLLFTISVSDNYATYSSSGEEQGKMVFFQITRNTIRRKKS